MIKDGTTWSFEIAAEQTKERRLHLAVLPDWCSPRIDWYVQHYRPLFPNAELTSRLWLSRSGRPLSEAALYRLVCKRTRAAFGKRINPHLIRSCLATSAALHHGAQIGLAMTVLRHQNFEITQRHYNKAKMIDAVRPIMRSCLVVPEEKEAMAWLDLPRKNSFWANLSVRGPGRTKEAHGDAVTWD